jgi:DNA-binding Xre family transcriptional regulator
MSGVSKPIDQSDMRDFLEQFGVPFARALGTFVREVLEGQNVPAEDGTKGSEIVAPQEWSQLPASVRQHFEATIQRNNELLKSGTLQSFEFTEEAPALGLANRLKAVAKQKGVSQQKLAERLKVSPSFVSKVLKNPDRSQLSTLRRIAEALGVELRDVL